VVRESTQKIDILMEERKQRMERDAKEEEEKKKLEGMGLAMPGMPNAYAQAPLALPAPAQLVSSGPVLPPHLMPNAHSNGPLMLPSGPMGY
jgi:hypothetical protein